MHFYADVFRAAFGSYRCRFRILRGCISKLELTALFQWLSGTRHSSPGLFHRLVYSSEVTLAFFDVLWSVRYYTRTMQQYTRKKPWTNVWINSGRPSRCAANHSIRMCRGTWLNDFLSFVDRMVECKFENTGKIKRKKSVWSHWQRSYSGRNQYWNHCQSGVEYWRKARISSAPEWPSLLVGRLRCFCIVSAHLHFQS